MTEMPPVTRPVTSIYRALIWEVRNHIRAVGLTMQQADDVAGLQDGYLAKMLHPDTPSGRQAQWPTLQLLLDAVYPNGFRLRLLPIAGMTATRASIDRKLARLNQKLTGVSINEREAQKGLLGRVAIRDLAREAGRKGGLARSARLSPQRRQRIARRAARARWKGRRRLGKQKLNERPFAQRCVALPKRDSRNPRQVGVQKET
jgi:hypothetical protein